MPVPHTERARPDCLLAGLGARAVEVLLPALAELGIGVQYVCDKDPQRAREFEALRRRGILPTGAVFATTLPKRLSDFELAVVAASHDAHYRLVSRLAAAGCRVLKEKPLARTLRESRVLVRKYSGQVAVLVERPYLEPFRLAPRLLNHIGPLQRYTITYWRTPRDYRATWRNDRRLSGGGVLLDLGYHVFDVVHRLFGRPVRVDATVLPHRPDRLDYAVDDEAVLSLTHESGCHGVIHLSRVAPRHIETYDAEGALGSMQLTKSQLIVRHADAPVQLMAFSSSPFQQAVLGIRGALSLVENPTQAGLECGHGLAVMHSIVAAYDSARSGFGSRLTRVVRR
jgi:predicted dehydrogenase